MAKPPPPRPSSSNRDKPLIAGTGSDFGRETIFTRKMSEVRLDRQKFKDAQSKVTSDRNRQKELPEEKLIGYENQTLYDKLTGLYNPRTFIRKLGYELKRARRYKRPLSLLIISIDNLDMLGDSYGALVIEDILKSVAEIVQKAIRDVDILSRCAHDQLSVILPETYSSQALRVGERIKERVATRPVSGDMRKLRITASIGIVSFPTHAREENELMTKALEYVEEAQSRGGDCVVHG